MSVPNAYILKESESFSVFLGGKGAQCVFVVWCACNALSRVQWYPKAAPSRVQCVFLLFFSSSAGRIHDP